MRLITDIFAFCRERGAEVEHDLDQRLPHPRGRLRRRAGGRVHARRRHRLRRGRASNAGLDVDEFARAALVLLQRAQQLHRGGREVPRRAAAVGAHHGASASAPRPTRAARCASTRRRRASTLQAQQPLVNVVRVDDAGARRGARRRAVAPHQQLRRGARPADRGGRAARAAHAAGDRARVAASPTSSIRSAAATPSRR